ncbi:MAG: hypothetical protein HYU30_10600 [Chloroflexi bacterium]|nr:hypothetical protein [Chloroflexota bacterium]
MATASNTIVGSPAGTKTRRWPNPLAWWQRAWASVHSPAMPLAYEDSDLSHRILKY